MQVDVGGRPIHYEQVGSGRPVLMLHGLPGDHWLPAHVLEPRFAERPGWRRLYPDLPGMGSTPSAGWEPTHEAMLDAALGFLDAVAPGERFCVVGVSYGGFLALGALHRRAVDVDGVVLWSPAVSMAPDRPAPAHRVFVQDQGVIASLAPDEQLWPQVAVVQTAEILAGFRAAVKPGLLAADGPFVEQLGQHAGFGFPLIPLPVAVEAPSLLVVGHQDSVVGFADLVDALAFFPRATLAVLDRAGHAIGMEQPDLFAGLVEDWLDRVEAEG